MRKNLAVFLISMAVLFVAAPAFAFENLCASNPDPTARIQCWQKGPPFSGLVPAQHAVRCPDHSTACYDEVLFRWAYCLPYAQAAAIAFTGTRGFADSPPAQWPSTIQNVGGSITLPPYGPQTMTPNYPKLIAAEGFGTGYFGANPVEATSYVMNMCLDSSLY